MTRRANARRDVLPHVQAAGRDFGNLIARDFKLMIGLSAVTDRRYSGVPAVIGLLQ
jgi:hypothetical protein